MIHSFSYIISYYNIGVAVVLQIDEFLASYVRIKDIDPELLGDKSWRTKMRLKSKIFLVLIAACIVYAVTAAIWKVDSMYCDAYDFERYQWLLVLVLFLVILIWRKRCELWVFDTSHPSISFSADWTVARLTRKYFSKQWVYLHFLSNWYFKIRINGNENRCLINKLYNIK